MSEYQYLGVDKLIFSVLYLTIKTSIIKCAMGGGAILKLHCVYIMYMSISIITVSVSRE